MVARCRSLVLPVVALLLAVAPVWAQDDASRWQELWNTPAIEDVCEAASRGPSAWFEADWMWTTREGASSHTRNFIGGPDATGFGDLSGLAGDSGYRLQGGVRLGSVIFEGVHTDLGGWDASLVRSVDGVAFNNGIGGDWLGRNFINGSTFFTPVSNAAGLGAPQNTVNDQSGLGPSTSFAADTRPLLMAFYHSELQVSELNAKSADLIFTRWGGGLRLGAGYAHASLNEVAQLVLSGTFRAVSNVGGPTVSLPDAALTASNGGDLTLYSGGATGFSDGTDGTGIPSQMRLTHQASTRNEFNGAQLILDGNFLSLCRLDVGGKLQAGLFDNFASGTIVETYGETNRDQSVYARRFENSHHQLAFLGGVAVNIGYHLADWIAVRGGYEVLFLSGVALAQDQVNGIHGSVYDVQTGGGTVIHGAHLGLEVAF